MKDEAEKALQQLREAAADLGPEALDATLAAVRAVVPEAQPLFTGEPYFGERAREVPKSMGF